MRKILLFIVSFPLLLVALIFDIIKLPIIILLSPVGIYLWIIDIIKGSALNYQSDLELFWEVIFLGIKIYLETVWD